MAAATLRVVHFRHRGLLLAGKSYSDVVAEAQSVMERPELAIGFKNRTLVCAGKAVPLQPITFAFAAWLAEQAARLEQLRLERIH